MAAARTLDPPAATEAKTARPDMNAASEAAKPTASGGWQAWLPLIVSLLVMPLLAFAVTQFILVPKLQKALQGSSAPAAATSESAGLNKAESGKEQPPALNERQNATLPKLLVNVAGTMGSRYLLTSLTLVGNRGDFVAKIAEKEPQLRDLASGLLCTKTIADLEKPGARNQIRSELLTGFNSILGGTAVQEIYFTEFAIQ